METHMNVSSEMQALCDHIISSSASRTDWLGSLCHDTDALQRDAQRMIKGFHDSFGAMARELRADLKHGNKARQRAVAGLREEYQEEFNATRADLVAAKGIWAAMAKG